MSCLVKTLKINVQMKNSAQNSKLNVFANVQISKEKSKAVKGGTAEIIIEEVAIS